MRSDLEHEAVDSQYVEAKHVPTVGPAHVILGSYEGVRSPARAPEGVTYLLVRLAAGSEWTFTPPSAEPLAWLAVSNGQLIGKTAADAGEMVIFERTARPITLKAGSDGDAIFVIGSATPHPHDLHLGSYSVHTSADSLAKGETTIERLRPLLVAAGDRRTASGSIPVFKD